MMYSYWVWQVRQINIWRHCKKDERQIRGRLGDNLLAEIQTTKALLVNEKWLQKMLTVSFTHTTNLMNYTSLFGLSAKKLRLGVGKNKIVDIKWDKEYLWEGDPPVSQEKGVKSHYLSWNWWCNDIIMMQQNEFVVKF